MKKPTYAYDSNMSFNGLIENPSTNQLLSY